MTPAELYKIAATLKAEAYKLEDVARKMILAKVDMSEDSGYELNRAEKDLIDHGDWVAAVQYFRDRMKTDLRTAKEIVDLYRI